MSYSNKLLAHYLELARTPVSTDRLGGEDVRFSSAYEALESELSKTQSMHETTQVDWSMVLESCEALLRHQSKDLRVASWLVWALYQRESFAGLLAGIVLLQVLCEQFWVELFPVKPRTRVAAIAWLVPRFEQALNQSIAIAEQLPLFRQMVERLEGLDAALTEKLGDEAPLLLPLCRSLKGRVQRASESQPEPGVVGAFVAQVKETAAQLLAPGAPVENEKDALKALRLQQDQSRSLCAWWLRQKATDLRALRLNRTLLWLSIDTEPERNAEQITALRGLPGDRLKIFRDRFEQGHFADLLVELEVSLAKAPFWFDGQRIAWECCEALSADAAQREIEVHLSLLLQRLPGVVELRFHDGSPFADPATRTWISGYVMPHLQSASAPEVVAPRARTDAWELALDEALPILRKDGLKAAVSSFNHSLKGIQGGRARFFGYLNLARLCIAAKKYELAKTQLEILDQDLQRAGLQTWEPELALDVLHLLYGCYELLPQNHAVRESKDEVYRRLCHLDLEALLD